MLTPQRLAMERAVLARKLPANTYHFCNMETDCPFLAVAARTNRLQRRTRRTRRATAVRCAPRSARRMFSAR